MFPAKKLLKGLALTALLVASVSMADAKANDKPYHDPAKPSDDEYGPAPTPSKPKPTKAQDNEYGPAPAPKPKPKPKPTPPSDEYSEPAKPTKKPTSKPPKPTEPAKKDGDYGDDGGKDQDQGKGNLVEISLSEFADGKLVEPKIRISKAYMKKNPAVTVHFKIQGVKCDKNSVKINKNCPVGGNKPIKCKPMGCPDKAKNGQMIDVPVTFDYEIHDAPPRKQEKQIVQRKVRGCGRCHGQGDPHILTFDNVGYDFHDPGVYKYYESGLLKIHTFQDVCKGAAPAGCIQATAIAYGESVVRLMIQEDRKIHVAKASDEMKWLSVKKLKNADGYRVVLNADHASSYVDVNFEEWQNSPYLNVIVQGSAALQGNGDGLMGNWNGNPDDDEKRPEELKKRYTVDDKLFTCTDCAGAVAEPTEDDLKHLELSSDEPRASDEGYEPVADLETKPFPVKPAPKRALRELFVEASQADVAEAARQCDQVIKAIPHCDKYVNQAFFIDTVCKGDFERVQKMDVIDNTKIAYLRDCRRAMDGILDSSSSTPEERAELEKMRGELQFGSDETCPGDCSGKGTCAPSGCKCNNGFSGMSCETAVAKPSEGSTATDAESSADDDDETTEDDPTAKPAPEASVAAQTEEEDTTGSDEE